MNKITFRLFSLFMFFAGMILTSAAFSQNFPERGYFSSADMDPYSEGWCCRTGEVFPAPVRACEAEGGTIFPSPEEAHHYCAGRCTTVEPRYLERHQEATPITLTGPRGVRGDHGQPPPWFEPQGRQPEGWCCRAGEVFPAPVRACEAEGGTIFPSPEEAHHYCAGRGTRGEPRYLERPQEATPITLPGPRGVQSDRPAPGIPPQSVPVPGMEPRGRMLPPEVPHIPRPDRSIQHMYPGPIHRPDSGQSGERIHGDSPVEATPITLP